ncbi:SDR family NAD(P)-dependent oxidoreductase [Mycobacteroides abscessus]
MVQSPKRVVVMTGATAGLGAQAASYIAAEPNTTLIIGARGTKTAPPGGVLLPLDLASLASVRAFATAVIDRLGDADIDVLVLNAGMQSSTTERRSADGFELIFAVNHLAHYLLARLLLPHIADNGRLIITTSDTHDPAITPLAPKSLDPEVLAHARSGSFGTGMRAYAASKLCNLMTAESLATLDETTTRGITVIAFNPGLTGGTSLGRDSSRARRMVLGVLMRTVFRLVGFLKPEYVMGTAQRSGQALAGVSLGTLTLPPGRMYLSLVKGEPTYPDPAELARSTKAQQNLWRASARMVGLDAN